MSKNANKSLGDMTYEELGRLFPIIISEYNPEWERLYKDESNYIINAAGARNIAAVHHIGSTSIESLKAKPTIDILLEINSDTDLMHLKNAIINIGYDFSEQKNNPPPHMMFMKGYTLKGFNGQAYHLHIRYKGSQDEFIFRDYLRKNKEAREQYAELKTRLQKEFEFDREGYTQSKTDFIKAIINKAKEIKL